MKFTKISNGMYENDTCWITDVWYMHEGDPSAIEQMGKTGWAYGSHGQMWGTARTLKEAKEICNASMAVA